MAWAAEVVSRREYLTAIVMVGFAIFVLGTVLAIAVTQFGWIAPSAELDSLGTVLRVDRVFARLMSTAIGAFIPSGILFIFLAPTGRLDIPLNHGQQIFLPFDVAFMVCLSVLAMYRAKLRGGLS